MSIVVWVLVILLVLFLLGGVAGPSWHPYPYTGHVGGYGIGTILVIILVVLLLTGRI
jgi:hypothetical protein